MQNASIILVGTPGAGKSVVSRLLAASLSAEYLSASNVLREYAGSNPEASKSWADFWREGENAPDDQVLPVLWDAFERRSRVGATILDGYPRTTLQLLDFINRGGWITLAVALNVSSGTAALRIEDRRAAGLRAEDASPIAHRRLHSEQQVYEGLLARLGEFAEHVITVNSDVLSPQEIADSVISRLDLS